jgi:putative ATPase
LPAAATRTSFVPRTGPRHPGRRAGYSGDKPVDPDVGGRIAWSVASASALFQGQTPLAVRMRPTSLEEVAGQGHLLRPDLRWSPSPTLRAPRRRRLGDPVGPAGTGKTTLAQAIARTSGRRFVELSAVTAGVKDVREVMQEAMTQRDLYGISTILFLDEIHRFTKAQQDALLPGVENGWVILIAATTENPSFSVISPLLSRSLLLTLKPLTDDDLACCSIAPSPIRADSTAPWCWMPRRARRSCSSPRATHAARSPRSRRRRRWSRTSPATPGRHHVAQAVDRALLRYDRQGDEHYDVISAFIKSIRGSDVDAAMHYLARMIEAGRTRASSPGGS